MKSRFRNALESHAHSLLTLNHLYEHDDFMMSVGSVADIGCGPEALDLQWWARATTRDEVASPLNIKCTGIDQVPLLGSEARRCGVVYNKMDAETWNHARTPFDVVWCHDTFQYMTDPMLCLRNWWNVTAPGGMLILIFPQFVNMEGRIQAFDLPSGCYHNHTIVSLMQMLAVNGWNCRDGFFKKSAGDPWIHAIVYRSEHAPMDPKITTWAHLAEKNLLPASAVDSINRSNMVRQRDLVLPWIDKSLDCLATQ